MNTELLHILACPQCRGPFRQIENGFLCESCSVVYPVADGIPVLLVEEAVPLADWQQRLQIRTPNKKDTP